MVVERGRTGMDGEPHGGHSLENIRGRGVGDGLCAPLRRLVLVDRVERWVRGGRGRLPHLWSKTAQSCMPEAQI